MLNLIKNLFYREKAEKSETVHTDTIDPRRVGYTDAVQSGWYQRDTGELLKGFQVAPEDTVLDVGCGDGLATLFCASFGAHVVFTDVDRSKIETLQEKAQRSKARKVEAYVSDSMPLPLSDAYASKVLAMEVLEHTQKPGEVLEEMFRVGKPGAQYLITVPDERSELLQKPFADPSYFSVPNHIHTFDKKSFCNLVEASGLVVDHYMTWGFYWVMWMSLFWSLPTKSAGEETLGLISPPYHDVLLRWSETWNEVLKIPDARKMVDAFNQAIPKAQAVIARKPE